MTTRCRAAMTVPMRSAWSIGTTIPVATTASVSGSAVCVVSGAAVGLTGCLSVTTTRIRPSGTEDLVPMLHDGIHDGIPADDYHADTLTEKPALSASILRTLIAKTPLHAWAAHPRLGNQTTQNDTDSLDLGTIVHRVILEGSYDVIRVIEADSYRSNDAKDARDAARSAGLIPVKLGDYAAIKTACDQIIGRIEGRTDSPRVFTNGKPEQTAIWTDNGVTCKARIDWLHNDLMVIDDLKTTGKSADPSVLARHIFQMGYDIQAAWYRRGASILTGRTPEFRFVFAETVPPYAVSVVNLSPAAYALADEKIRYGRDLWKTSLHHNKWAGYTTAVATIEPPGWAEAAFFDHIDAQEAA